MQSKKGVFIVNCDISVAARMVEEGLLTLIDADKAASRYWPFGTIEFLRRRTEGTHVICEWCAPPGALVIVVLVITTAG